VTSYTYDAAGHLASVTDAAGRTTFFTYDSAGRILARTLPDSRVIAYSYDGTGNLLSLTPPGRPAHLFSYTPVNLEAGYFPPTPQPPLANPETLFTYNFDKQLSRITRPDGLPIDFLYDVAGRLSQQLLPGNEAITRTYDPTTGQLLTITAPDGGVVSFTFDGSLLLSESWSGTITGTVSRMYDSDFGVVAQSVNGANTVAFSYDGDNLMTSAGALKRKKLTWGQAWKVGIEEGRVAGG